MDSLEAKDIINHLIKQKKAALVFTPNAEIVVQAHADKEFLEILRSAQLILPDGSSLLWAAKALKKPLKARVTGIDLMQLLLPEAEKKGWTVFFLGAKQEILEKAVFNTLRNYPSLKLAGYHHGYFKNDIIPLQVINQVKPDLLFVGMGAPKQERWLYQYKNQLECGVAMVVGGSFDILAGKTKRAPFWMQKRGLEWLYRYLQEPARIKRSLLLPKFVGLVLAERKRLRKKEGLF